MQLGFTLHQRVRSPTYADVPIYQKKYGIRPKKVAIVIPHSSEIPATLPFSRALSKKLMEGGIQTTTITTTDMMMRGWEVRSQLADVKLYGYDCVALSATLSIEDILIRTRTLLRLLSDRSVMVLELHAYNRKGIDEYCPNPKRWRGLGGTEILVQALPFDQSFSDALDINISEIDKSPGIADKVAQLRGMDLGGAIQELKGKLRQLEAYRSRIRLVELPSISEYLQPSHFAFGFYFSADGRSLKSDGTAFEQDYCAAFRKGMGFNERDVQSVASILTIPALRYGKGSKNQLSDVARTMLALMEDDI